MISENDAKAKEDPLLSKIKGGDEMSDIYKYITAKGGSNDGML